MPVLTNGNTSNTYWVFTQAAGGGGSYLTSSAQDTNVRANVIAFGTFANTDPATNIANVGAAITAAVMDYSPIYGKMISLMINMESNIARIQSHVDQIRSNIALIADDIDVIRNRAENHDLGIVTRTSNTDCWTDTCVYDYSLVEMALRDSNILGQYNQIVVDNGGSPIS